MGLNEKSITQEKRLCDKCGKKTSHEMTIAKLRAGTARTTRKVKVVKMICLECGYITRMPND
jgi:hypothetical protein